MPIDSGNLALKGLDNLFSTEENRQEEQREQVQQIPIDALHPFTNHPFKVLHSGIKGNFLFVHHVQQFRDKAGQADKTLDLSAAFSAFLSDNIGSFKIPDKLSGIFF